MYTYLHQKPEGLFVIQNEMEKPDTFIMPYDKNENEDVDIYDAVISFRISESKKWLSESKHYKVADSDKWNFYKLALKKSIAWNSETLEKHLSKMMLMPNECVEIKTICEAPRVWPTNVEPRFIDFAFFVDKQEVSEESQENIWNEIFALIVPGNKSIKDFKSKFKITRIK